MPRRCICCGGSEFEDKLGGVKRCTNCGREERWDPFYECPVAGCGGRLYAGETYQQGSVRVTERKCNNTKCQGRVTVVSSVVELRQLRKPRVSGPQAAIQRIFKLTSEEFRRVTFWGKKP